MHVTRRQRRGERRRSAAAPALAGRRANKSGPRRVGPGRGVQTKAAHDEHGGGLTVDVMFGAHAGNGFLCRREPFRMLDPVEFDAAGVELHAAEY